MLLGETVIVQCQECMERFQGWEKALAHSERTGHSSLQPLQKKMCEMVRVHEPGPATYTCRIYYTEYNEKGVIVKQYPKDIYLCTDCAVECFEIYEDDFLSCERL